MKIWGLIVFCLGLRLIGLNQSLWLDEAISANVAKNNSFKEIVTKFSVNDFHPPVYYFVLKGWTGIFGYSEISLRLPSIIFSLITVYLIYQLAGIWPALITGINPLLIYYSQEARMYSLVTMWLSLAVYLLIKRKYWWYSLIAFFSLTTFYGSIFMLGAVALYLLKNKKYKELLITNVGLLLAVVILLPLLYIQNNHANEMLFLVKNWNLVLGKANLKNLFLIPLKFSIGRISFEPKILYYLIGAWFSVLVFKNLLKRNFYGYIFWTTLIIGVLFSFFTPMLQYFRFIYLIPLMAVMIGKNKMVAVGFTIFSLAYLLNPKFYREDWKMAVQNLKNVNEIYMIGSFSDPVLYYNNKIVINDLRDSISASNITVIPYGEAIHGVDHKALLVSKKYELKQIVDYREVTVENWQLIY